MNQELFEKIESYLLNRMSETERSEFEARMASDASLQEEVITLQQLLSGIDTYGLKKKLNTYHIPRDSNTTSPLVRRRSHFNLLRVAAGILILFSVGWWYFANTHSGNTADRWGTVFYPDPGLPTSMGTTDHYNFYDAMVDYKNDNYPLALQKFNTITNGIGQDTLTYYKAMAHLQLGHLKEAGQLLNKISKESPFYGAAIWYKTGIAIKEGRNSDALKLLDVVPDTREFNKRQARELIEE